MKQKVMGMSPTITLGWITQYQSITELMVSSQNINSLISGSDSSCSWVLNCALGLGEGKSSRLKCWVGVGDVCEN